MRTLKNIKRKLTLFFVIIVFVLITMISFSSSITKYLGGYSFEKEEFEKFIANIERQIQQNKNVIPFLEMRHRLLKENGEIRHHDGENTFKSRGMVSYIFLLKNGTIASSNVQENISDTLINQSIQDDAYSQLQYKNSFFIQKIHTPKGTLVAFKGLRYSLSELLEDLLLFFGINVLFGLLVYLIGRRFVERVFVPVEENIDDMKQFVHNAGHELKTPIAVMDSNVQLLLDMKQFDREMTLEMRDELKKMNALIDSLIDLSDIDTFQQTESNNLSEVVDEVISNYAEKIQEKNLTIRCEIPKDLTIQAHKNSLFIFLSNLIGNAVKYNTKNGKVDIFYRKGTLSIKDSGIGIAAKDIKKIFERFYQADTSRQSDGFGIGLSLVKKIATVSGWKIEVKSEEGKGSEFEVRF